MKKFFILSVLVASAIVVMGQVPVRERALLHKSIQKEFRPALRDLPEFTMPINYTVSVYGDIPEEEIIGVTWYDAFTNSFTSNNLVRYADGTMAATWTFGLQATAFPDRGSGYNYFDGQTWGADPVARIESLRTGWGHITDWAPGGEMVFAHDADNLALSRRPAKGTGAWTELDYTGAGAPSWPKVVSSGENHEYLHVLYHTYDDYAGMPGGAMIYSRTTDGGNTWDPKDVILDGTGPDYYYEIQGETYNITARGNTVAILVGSAWNDMFIMKSTDNGDNWEKIMIWEHPYPFFDFESTLTDTMFVMDNSADIALDPDGMCHVVFGITRVMHDALGTTYSVFPYIDGIGYWNETMPAFSNDLSALAPPQYEYPTSEMTEDYNYIGWTQDMDGDGEITLINTSTGFPMSYDSYGLSTMPTLHIDDEGAMFLVYASTTETYDNFEWNYKKLWMRTNITGTWGAFEHLTRDITHIFDESIYPTIAETSDADYFYMVYQADGTPGLALNGDHDYQENRIIAAQVPKGWIGMDELHPSAPVSLSNYPNPFHKSTVVSAVLNISGHVNLVITDLTGRIVKEIDRGDVEKGTVHFTLARDGLPGGIYILTLNVDDFSCSHKMVID